MATMIPFAIPDAPKSNQVVFDLLRDDPATRDWVIIHGVKCPPSGQQQQGIDFLALVPDGAILLLEVKGGGFEVKKGQWYTQSSQEHIPPPGKQAEKAMNRLENQLRAKFSGWFADSELPMDCVVLFTDTTWPPDLRPLGYPTVGLPDLETQMDQTLGERLGEIAQETRNDFPNGLPLNENAIKNLQEYLLNEYC